MSIAHAQSADSAKRHRQSDQMHLCVSWLQLFGFGINAIGCSPAFWRLKKFSGRKSLIIKSHLRSTLGCLLYQWRFVPNFASESQALSSVRSSHGYRWAKRTGIWLSSIPTSTCLKPLAVSVTRTPYPKQAALASQILFHPVSRLA